MNQVAELKELNIKIKTELDLSKDGQGMYRRSSFIEHKTLFTESDLLEDKKT